MHVCTSNYENFLSVNHSQNKWANTDLRERSVFYLETCFQIPLLSLTLHLFLNSSVGWGGLERVNGGEKEEICNTFKNQDLIKNKQQCVS